MARFLIVDTETNAVVALQELLELDGHEVSAFTNAPKAINDLSRSKFDVILVDLEMPTMPAERIVRLARKHHPSACLFVMTSRYAPNEIAVACRVFDKPLDYKAITRIVAECRSHYGPRHPGGCYLNPVAMP
jgi:DNA-binding NtrC family response regulator